MSDLTYALTEEIGDPLIAWPFGGSRGALAAENAVLGLTGKSATAKYGVEQFSERFGKSANVVGGLS